MSWVTNSTAVPCSRRRRSSSAATSCWCRRSSAASGSSHSRSAGSAGQRRGHPDPLQLAAGQHGHRRVAEAVRADRGQQLVDPVRTARRRAPKAIGTPQRCPSRPHPHQVPGLEHGGRVDGDPLRARTRRRCCRGPSGRPPIEARRRRSAAARRAAPAAGWSCPSRWNRASRRTRRARRQVQVTPQHPVAERQPGVAQSQRRHLGDADRRDGRRRPVQRVARSVIRPAPATAPGCSPASTSR